MEANQSIEKQIFSENIESFDHDNSYDDFSEMDFVDFKKDPQWIEFNRDCEEYNLDIENEDDIEYEYNPYQYVRYPIIDNTVDLNEKYKENMVILGCVSPKKKNKSFKYSYNSKKNFGIFCLSVTKKNTKCNKNCKLPHNFNEIPFCNSKCNRITLENNFYSGNCNKRHNMETVDNFMIRKHVKLNDINDITLEFFERPSSELIKELLTISKKLHINNITIKIVTKKITLDEFMNIKNYDEDEDENIQCDDNLFNKLWN